MALTNQNIEAELSYAYLHAIAGKAGISCKPGDRHDDGEGVDAEVNYRGKTTHSYIRQVQLNIQLKATVKPSGSYADHHSYYIKGKDRYEKLRTNDSDIYKLLIVLFLPPDPKDWLSCTPDELILKKSAYWVNLYGADACSNLTGETVYLPKANLLTPEELFRIVDLAANKKIPSYKKP